MQICTTLHFLNINKLFAHPHICTSAYLHIILTFRHYIYKMIFLTFFLGLVSNFIGYIPPGNVNLTAVKITINRGMKQALQFIIAFSSVEFFFTYAIMHAAEWLSEQVKLDVMIDWFMVVLFSVLGTITWLNRNRPPKTKSSDSASIKQGIFLGFVNPMQVPFWMVTGTYLITHQWILTGVWELAIFSLGSSAGAFLCLFIYAEFARYIRNKLGLSTKVINTAIAILFFAFAAYHIVKRVYLNVKHKHKSQPAYVIDPAAARPVCFSCSRFSLPYGLSTRKI